MKHTFVLFLSLILLVLPGCSAEKSSADTAKKTLTIYSTMSTDSERDTFRKLAAAFEKEHSDIHVSLHFPGNDYENMMRVRMAVMICLIYSIHMAGGKSGTENIQRISRIWNGLKILIPI